MVSKGYNIMIKLGWEPMKGLGKNLSGILLPITCKREVSEKYGGNVSPDRIGLGVPSISGWSRKNYKKNYELLRKKCPVYHSYAQPIRFNLENSEILENMSNTNDIPPRPPLSELNGIPPPPPLSDFNNILKLFCY